MSNKNLDNHEYAENAPLFNNVQRLNLKVKEASGSKIYSHSVVDGKGHITPLLDYWGDEGVCALGYNSSTYKEAIESFMASHEPHQLPDVYPEVTRTHCAEQLTERTGFDRVFFANSGTEANEAAIKLARKYWWDKEPPLKGNEHIPHERHKILTVEGNFHGRTGLSMAASDPRVSPYHRWGFGPTAQGFGVIDWDGSDDEHAWCQSVEDGREGPTFVPDWSEVAAIILAPILGNNCVTTYNEEFWQALESVRAEHGTLIIFDDVQAGSGRAGALATWKTVGLKPDIMTLGKGLAMGFPMSAMLAREEVAASFTPGVHFNTFGGSPFVCYMAIKMMEWLDENQNNANIKGDAIRQSFKNRDWIKSCDGSGMLNAFLPDYERFGYNGYDLCAASRSLGLSLMTHRPLGPIRFTPRLNVPMAELIEAFEILDRAHTLAHAAARIR